MWRRWVGLFASATIALAACRSEKSRADAGTMTRFDARAAIANAKVSAVAFAAVNREREVVLGGEGFADRARKIVADPATVFEAASIAKLIVATCAMQLVEAGKLTLDADVNGYLGFAVRHPSFDDRITMRMLLTHRAAIRDRNDELTAHAPGNALEPFLKHYLLDGATPRGVSFLDVRPGTRMQYSNVGAALAALVVQRVAGEDFAELSTRRVFAPLGMPSTRWVAAGPTSAVTAIPYAYRDGELVSLPPPSHAVYPAVDLHSTSRDLSRFARAVLREGELDGARILSADSVRLMLQPVSPGDEETAGATSDQALAWQIRTIGGARVAGHEGEDAGATTALFIDVAAGSAAVILANGDAFSSGDATRVAPIQSMLAELLARARR